MDKVAIILVEYNNEKYLRDCLESLFCQTYTNIEIVLVNNASPGSATNHLEEYVEKIEYIELKKNVGFAGACNVGMDYALQKGAHFCMLLNVDTVAKCNMVEKLVEASGGNNVTGPFIYNTCGKSFVPYNKEECGIWYAGGSIDPFSADVNQLLYVDEKDCRMVDFISGCCMLLPRKCIEVVGKMTTDFFMYYEDVDYCIRLKKSKINLLYVPESVLWHAETGSQTDDRGLSHDYFCMRNKLMILRKYSDDFEVNLIDFIRKNLNTLSQIDDILVRENVKAQKKGIYDFLEGKIGEYE